MASYAYFAATLPMLRKRSEPPFEMTEFLDLCRSQLSPHDFQVVGQASFDGSGEPLHPLVLRWNEFRQALKQELASYRADQLGIVSEAYSIKFRSIPAVIEIVKRTAAAADPLEAADILYDYEWMFIDELSVNHYFDLEMIICYSLKLQLLVRLSYRTRSRGIESFGHAFSNIRVTAQ